MEIKGYENLYAISEYGVITSLERIIIRSDGMSAKIKSRVMRTTTSASSGGYVTVSLCKEGVHTRYLIHRLLAIAFISNPNNYPVVRHLNDIKIDNRLENLAWGTYSDNKFDAVRNGKQSYNFATLSKNDVREIKILLRESKLAHEVIAELYGVHKVTIGDINIGKTWKTIII